MDDFLFMADRDVAAVAAKDFKKQGLDIKLGAKANGRRRSARMAYTVSVNYDDKDGAFRSTVDRRQAGRGCWATSIYRMDLLGRRCGHSTG